MPKGLNSRGSRDIFQRSFQTGLGVGASNFQLQERERIDIEKQQAKDREKRRIENQKSDALNVALGVDVNNPDEFDPLTKKPKPNAGRINLPNIGLDVGDPEGFQRELPQQEQKFQRPNPRDQARIEASLSPENRAIYKDFLKREDPSISDEYFGVKEKKHLDREGGGLYGFNRESGEQELIQDLPNYQPKPVVGGSYVVYGTADLNGEQVGIKGRRTRIVEMEGGGHKIQDLGIIPRGSKNSEDEKSQLEFEISMADFQNTADGLANRKQQYLSKDFSQIGGESTREDYRVGYNSGMHELALRTLKLGSPEAEAEGMKIWNQGKNMITDAGGLGLFNSTNMTKENYADAMTNNILEEYRKTDGKWDYKDTQSIIKFLEYKYKRYLPKGESQADNIDFFNDFEFDKEGNIK